ncbi:MAG: NTP transferase domain-containing protein [Patescibacteria group bacterium]|nr:NTP transferase domain-containing protein [Patescibacteria group bacterium]
MIVGIILAAGKGKRAGSKTVNKVTLPFLGRPLVTYALELISQVTEKNVVVVGAFSQSVRAVLQSYSGLIYAYQTKRLGTGHSVKVAVRKIVELNLRPKLVLVGQGDHMMFYEKSDLERLIKIHKKENSVLSFFTTRTRENDRLHWGYVIRDNKGKVIDNIEYKDAPASVRKTVTEVNAGFYCFDFEFLRKNIDKIPKSPISGEYYLNQMIRIANDKKLPAVGVELPFASVGIGVNTKEELEESQKLYLSTKKYQRLG